MKPPKVPRATTPKAVKVVKTQIAGERRAISGYKQAGEEDPARAPLYRHIGHEEVGHEKELRETLKPGNTATNRQLTIDELAKRSKETR